ncbi:MAG: hypothetical protein M5R41_19200 [Bacteroidia bacterium]|nr:hypothetical protein [Bacteroidia bacterium]
MHSYAKLPELERIPLRNKHRRYSWSETIKQSNRMRNDLFAIEIGAGLEVGLRGIFDAHNVTDDLFEAYQRAAPDIATKFSLYDRYLEMVERGPDSAVGFISNVKGKLAEIRMPEHLAQEYPGFSFSLASSQNQAGWDIFGTNVEGTDVFFQVKVGGSGYANNVMSSMEANPDTLFVVSNEIRDAIVTHHPEMAGQLLHVNLSNYELTSEVQENMNLLADNFGIDVPDAVGDFLPYVSEIVLGIRLIYDIVKVERDFGSVNIDDRGRMHAMKALVLFQRFGVSTVCTIVGGSAGTAVLPGFGTFGGAVSGAVAAAYLNRKIRPHTMDLAMCLFQVTEDDIFYFRNKPAIDNVGASLSLSASSIQNHPAFGSLQS